MAEDIKVSEFIVNELSEEKLEELKSTNAVPPNEMFLTNEEGEQFPRGLPLGTIIPLAVVTDDPYLQPLDGRSLAQDGMYAEFCTWLKNRVLANSSNVPTCTIAEYATEMNTYFQCGKFVINDTAETVTSGNYSVPANSIKLPTITEFIASNNGGDAIGLAELDEFKSHTHGVNVQQGRYTVVQNGSGDWCSTYSNNYTLAAGGEETRPKNVRYPYYIVVATSLNDSAAISAEGVVSEVNTVKDVLSRTEQVDVVYDMTSPNSNINKGFTSGLLPNTEYEIDFTKYKKLLIYSACYANQGVTILDLQKQRDSGGYASSNVILSDMVNSQYSTLRGTFIVLANKTTFKQDLNWFHLNNTQAQTDGYIVYKIEGVY